MSDKEAKYPHGACECTLGGCPSCSVVPGPAAYVVVRGGKAIRVCTRCDLPTDQARQVLVTVADPVGMYFAWDELGAACLACEVVGRTKGGVTNDLN